MTKNLIALDADGVLLDYHSAYALAWERAFGRKPDVVDPHAYWTVDRLGVEWLEGESLAHFRKQFDKCFWSSIPAMPSAVAACNDLATAGFELVCVTAMDAEYQSYRLKNLQAEGFPISKVIATGKEVKTESPKSGVIRQLQPMAFVDDFLPYFSGIEHGIHKALIMRDPHGSPNVGADLENIHSQHADLRAFVDWWLDR